MQYTIKIAGRESLIMHSAAGLDQQLLVNVEIAQIAAKKGSNRTATDEHRLRQLEVIKSIWTDERGNPEVPTSAIRTCIEKAARKTKEGPQVREGLTVLSSTFTHTHGETLEELADSTAFTVPVAVQRSRILRTRAKFDTPWSVDFVVDTDPELVEQRNLEAWIAVGGQRIGLGDWRPEKSGKYGRFALESIAPME